VIDGTPDPVGFTDEEKRKKRIALLKTQHIKIRDKIDEFVQLNIVCNIALLKLALNTIPNIVDHVEQSVIDKLNVFDKDNKNVDLLEIFYTVDLFLDFFFNGCVDDKGHYFYYDEKSGKIMREKKVEKNGKIKSTFKVVLIE
jgi:hypothetical protein